MVTERALGSLSAGYSHSRTYSPAEPLHLTPAHCHVCPCQARYLYSQIANDITHVFLWGNDLTRMTGSSGFGQLLLPLHGTQPAMQFQP